jgi:hypothetical protein
MVRLSRILSALHPGFLGIEFLLFIHGHPWVKPDMHFSFLIPTRVRKPFDSHKLTCTVLWLPNCSYYCRAYTLHQSMATYAAFFEESRTRLDDATEPDRKSGGSRGTCCAPFPLTTPYALYSRASDPAQPTDVPSPLL